VSVTSVGICVPGELDFDLLNGWVQSLLAANGQNIYRMKGILNVKGEEDRFVFQGVHMVKCSFASIAISSIILTLYLTDVRWSAGPSMATRRG
jgi:G3E family GTPase